MSQYTYPDDLPQPQAGDQVAPLEDYISDLADATQVALMRPGTVASATDRDTQIPNPVPGYTVWRTDKTWREMYFAASGTQRAAGWYPVEGLTPDIVLSGTSNSDQMVAPSTSTTIVFLYTEYNTNSGSVTNGTFVIPVSGRYLIMGAALFNANATAGTRRMAVTANSTSIDTGILTADENPTASGTYATPLSNSKVVSLNAGDVIRLIVWHTAAGTNLNVSRSQAGRTFLGARYMGPA